MKYIQCLVCGKLTPTDRGICYHCSAPLPTSIDIPAGTIVCPNCLKVTTIETGYCRHCKAPLPQELVEEARAKMASLRLQQLKKKLVLRLGPLRERILIPGPV